MSYVVNIANWIVFMPFIAHDFVVLKKFHCTLFPVDPTHIGMYLCMQFNYVSLEVCYRVMDK